MGKKNIVKTPKTNRKDKRLQKSILEMVHFFFIKFKFYCHPLRKPQTSGESIMSIKIGNQAHRFESHVISCFDFKALRNLHSLRMTVVEMERWLRG